MGPETGEVVVSVERPDTGDLAAPLGAELDTEPLQSPHSAPDEDPRTCRVDMTSGFSEALCKYKISCQ